MNLSWYESLQFSHYKGLSDFFSGGSNDKRQKELSNEICRRATKFILHNFFYRTSLGAAATKSEKATVTRSVLRRPLPDVARLYLANFDCRDGKRSQKGPLFYKIIAKCFMFAQRGICAVTLISWDFIGLYICNFSSVATSPFFSKYNLDRQHRWASGYQATSYFRQLKAEIRLCIPVAALVFAFFLMFLYHLIQLIWIIIYVSAYMCNKVPLDMWKAAVYAFIPPLITPFVHFSILTDHS